MSRVIQLIFNKQNLSRYTASNARYPESSYFYGMGEISLQDAINQFLQKSRLKSGIQALRIEDVWEEIMGKTVSKYTDKIQIINSTLFVSTQVAPLKNELLYQKEKIIERVNEALGEKTVKEVVIR